MLYCFTRTWTIYSKRCICSLINFVGGNAWYNVTVRNETEYFNDNDYLASRLGAGLDFRAKNIDSFDNLEENAIFYASVKSLYLQDNYKNT